VEVVQEGRINNNTHRSYHVVVRMLGQLGQEPGSSSTRNTLLLLVSMAGTALLALVYIQAPVAAVSVMGMTAKACFKRRESSKQLGVRVPAPVLLLLLSHPQQHSLAALQQIQHPSPMQQLGNYQEGRQACQLA
jgi:hypothetical protein